MDRKMSWCVLLASTLLPTAQAAEPGFYIGATASRVEHDVDGGGVGGPIVILTPPPSGGFLPPPAFGVAPIFGGIIGSPMAILGALDRVEVDDGQAGWSVTLGYRVNQYLAAEVAYVDFGETSVTEYYTFTGLPPFPPMNAFSRYDISVSGPAASVIGSLPLSPAWQLFLRGGVLFADQEVEFGGGSGNDITYGDEVWMAGAGVQWSFASRWTARLEYQVTEDLQENAVAGESRLEQASLSVLFNL